MSIQSGPVVLCEGNGLLHTDIRIEIGKTAEQGRGLSGGGTRVFPASDHAYDEFRAALPVPPLWERFRPHGD